MREPDYRGVAALIIAVCGAVGIFVIVPVTVLMGRNLSEVGSDVVIALGGVLVGALATYMGMQLNGKEVLSQAPPSSESNKETNNEADRN
jgi:hypothetical protein